MNAPDRLRLLTADTHAADSPRAPGAVVALGNDADVIEHADAIARAARVELHFPSFTDGRAYSQAYLVRRRLGFRGDLRATGEVLADQLMLMERTGFSSAVLADGVAFDDALRQLERFPAFYQADARQAAPFRRDGDG
ncbi:DUF934 domain-containing protein [Burkholderia plantarii]|uniref:Oxidoreductase n=1 Tax=Burkholderia plantarii TaxID=41899 RepID=A0A0B6S559_BURPL|nr:DUF934 domain-containing protein [Burkholderia plantarii]AJK48440.1 hypothetical protein BGL_2c03440 [Burkholderia plantarii]ALK32660.1 hypothetical protein bpln_2g03950 [Burkholderia plantarii]GLZ20038.1 hypothetical protein Bpla01_35670 [Burkholderia plantarii]